MPIKRRAIWNLYLGQFELDPEQKLPHDEQWTGAEIRALLPVVGPVGRAPGASRAERRARGGHCRRVGRSSAYLGHPHSRNHPEPSRQLRAAGSQLRLDQVHVHPVHSSAGGADVVESQFPRPRDALVNAELRADLAKVDLPQDRDLQGARLRRVGVQFLGGSDGWVKSEACFRPTGLWAQSVR